MEFKKEKVGTGRFTHLILKNSEIIVGIGFDDNKRFQELLQDPDYQTYVLYPGDQVMDLSGKDAKEQFGPGKKQFIVIDGTWPCAKKMMKLTTSLHLLTRVSFAHERVSEFKVKHQPLPGCLSTVESIHQVLVELNKLGIENTSDRHENLMAVFIKTVVQQMELASNPKTQGYRRKPYGIPEARKISKKWQERLLFFRCNSK